MEETSSGWDEPVEPDPHPNPATSPALAAGPSPRGFAIGLYLEHLEEASFLYEQRLSLLDDPELAWTDLRAFEDRLEAHLDALVLGGDLAWAVCRQQAREGDAGELHAAVRVACRQRRWELVGEALDALEADDERIQAVGDALGHEAPAAWEPELRGVVARGGSAALVAAATLGYHRMPAGPDVLRALERAEGDDPLPYIRALGRLRYAPALHPLFRSHLQHGDDAVRAAAALACLRMGEPAVVPYVLGQPAPWAALPLGLGGGRAAVTRLLERAASGGASPDGLLALGLLGDPAAVAALLYHLSDEALAGAAALALHLLTGAELFEEVVVPDEVDDEEEFEGERERLQADAPSSAAPPAGSKHVRITQNPEAWGGWWEQNRHAFPAGARYRNGMPASPMALLLTLRAERLPRSVRHLAYEELAIRYGCPAPFEADWFVARQERGLAEIEAWARGGPFQPGNWYFAGRAVS